MFFRKAKFEAVIFLPNVMKSTVGNEFPKICRYIERGDTAILTHLAETLQRHRALEVVRQNRSKYR